MSDIPTLDLGWDEDELAVIDSAWAMVAKYDPCFAVDCEYHGLLPLDYAIANTKHGELFVEIDIDLMNEHLSNIYDRIQQNFDKRSV